MTWRWLGALVGLIALSASATTLTKAPSVNIGGRQATLSWETDVASSTEIGWGTVSAPSFAAYPNHSSFSAAVTTKHSRSIAKPLAKTYFFRVRSVDAAMNAVESAEGTFTVPPSALFPRDDMPAFDADVSAVLRHGNAWYLTGSFSQTFMPTSAAVALDYPSAAPSAQPFPMLTESADAIISDGAGGVFISGRFTTVHGFQTGNIVHVLPDRGVDPDFKASVTNGTILTMALSGGALYVGGDFTTVDGISRRRLAAFDATTGALLAWNPSANNVVNAIAVVGATTYIAGAFTRLNGTSFTRNRLAALDSAGVPTSWNPNLNSQVTTMAISTDTIYVGGWFTTASATTRNYAAAFDLATGTLNAWNPNLNDGVDDLAIGSSIYLAGQFTQVNGSVGRLGLAAFDPVGSPTAGTVTNWDPAADSTSYALTVSGNSVFVSGYFQNIGGATRNGHAELSTTTALATAWNPSVVGARVTVLNASSVLLTNVDPSSTPRTPIRNPVAIDALTGAVLPWDVQVDGINTVHAMVARGNEIFIAGDFTMVAGAPAPGNIISVDAVTGAYSGWSATANFVENLYLSGNTLYAVGRLTQANGQTRNGAASFDLSTRQLLPWRPKVSTTLGRWVSSGLVSGNTVYLAGYPYVVNGEIRQGVAAVDSTTAALLPLYVSTNNPVYALTRIQNTIYIAGSFTTVLDGVRPASSGAAFDEVSGQLTAWNPGADNTILAVAPSLDGEAVYVGGYFSRIDGGMIRAGGIGATDPATGAALPWALEVSGAVTSITADCAAAGLGLAGSFSSIDGVPAWNFAVVSDPAHCPGVEALAAMSNDAGVLDAGTVADAGTVDAGVADAGAADAAVESDAGAPLDGGNDSDASVVSDDAGAPDASVEPSDAGDAGDSLDAGAADGSIPVSGVDGSDASVNMNDAGVDGGTKKMRQLPPVSDLTRNCGCTSAPPLAMVAFVALLRVLGRRRLRRTWNRTAS